MPSTSCCAIQLGVYFWLKNKIVYFVSSITIGRGNCYEVEEAKQVKKLNLNPMKSVEFKEGHG